MKQVRYHLDREVPILHEADVVVAGGGPGGLGAAVMAAREGARTLLIERYGFLGGMAAAGEVSPFMDNHVRGESLDQPVYQEWVERMKRYWPREGRERAISKDCAMLAAEDLCMEAGVRLLYHHSVADVLREGRRIETLILLSKSGYTAAKGVQYVDCTGDADLAALAGCQFEMGGPTGPCQAMSVCFKLCNVDRAQFPDYEPLARIYQAAQARGEIDCPRDFVLFFSWLRDDVVHFNTTRIIHKNATDGAELSEAEIEGRRQVRQFLEFFRRHVPGCARAQLHSLAHQIGVRESRRVRGLDYLTREAFTQARKCPDAIARVHYMIDIHNPDGSGTEIVRLPPDEWYEIPYGCVVARDADNLTIGGRPISVDHAIHASMRIMPVCCSVGSAAGLAAALAAARGCRPADLGGTEVRRRLIERGANLA